MKKLLSMLIALAMFATCVVAFAEDADKTAAVVQELQTLLHTELFGHK